MAKKKLATDWQGRGKPSKMQQDFIKKVRSMPERGAGRGGATRGKK